MTRYRVSADAAAASLEGGAVLLHMGTKRYYSLNETGAVVWQALEEGLEERETATRLVAEYEVGDAAALASVGALVSALVAEGLLEAVEALAP
jgi:predicted ATP-dependent protease